MPTEDEFWKAAAQVVAERGGLVVGFTEASDQPELGSTLDNVMGFRPPRIPTVVGSNELVKIPRPPLPTADSEAVGTRLDHEDP